MLMMLSYAVFAGVRAETVATVLGTLGGCAHDAVLVVWCSCWVSLVLPACLPGCGVNSRS